MAFAKESARTPVAIERIRVELTTHAPGSEGVPSAWYFVQVRFSNDSIEERTGDLIPHLTTAQTNQLLAFMATLRTKAISEFLPG
jgi:hypothetical protein